MSAGKRVIGIDPKQVPASSSWIWPGPASSISVVQCSRDLAPAIFVGLLAEDRSNLVGLKQFVVRDRAAGQLSSGLYSTPELWRELDPWLKRWPRACLGRASRSWPVPWFRPESLARSERCQAGPRTPEPRRARA